VSDTALRANSTGKVTVKPVPKRQEWDINFSSMKQTVGEGGLRMSYLTYAKTMPKSGFGLADQCLTTLRSATVLPLKPVRPRTEPNFPV